MSVVTAGQAAAALMADNFELRNLEIIDANSGA